MSDCEEATKWFGILSFAFGIALIVTSGLAYVKPLGLDWFSETQNLWSWGLVLLVLSGILAYLHREYC